jgi:hypothetical protein
MSETDFYLTQDHPARGRTTLISIIGGSIAGAVAQLIGLSFEVSAVFCVSAVGLLEAYRALTYLGPDRIRRRSIKSFPIRRELVSTGFSALVLLILSQLPIRSWAEFALDRSLQRVSTAPTDVQSVMQTKKILGRAKAAQLKLNPATVQLVGKQLIDASDHTPGAWDAALDTLSYQSLNQSQPALGKLNGHPPTHYVYQADTGQPAPGVTNYGNVPMDRAAQLYKIGEEDPNRDHQYGDAYLVVRDAHGFLLDGLHMKNIVLRNSTIRYHGGQVVLDHVSFIDCTFEISKDQNGEVLANALLRPTEPVTLTIG